MIYTLISKLKKSFAMGFGGTVSAMITTLKTINEIEKALLTH